MIKSKKNKNLVRSIRVIWESLDTHLDDCFKPAPYKNLRDSKVKRVLKENLGGSTFHIKTVKEYAEIIKLLADLL